MKQMIQLLMIIALPFFSVTTFQSCSSQTVVVPQDTWTKLATRNITKRADRDVIKVGAAKGNFSAIRITIRQAPINMHRCVVHFANGTSQTIKLRKNFKRGQSSASHDLRGPDRRIDRVEFWYDTVNAARTRASLELWAKT